MKINLNKTVLNRILKFIEAHSILLLVLVLSVISIASFAHYYNNGLGLAYNDARSHLNIGRRVVEGLKPGLAQIGSVWLPLPHVLMVFTIWDDFMWHSGLAGAIISMVSFVATGILVYLFLKELGVSLWPRLLGVAIFVANINILYLQSTAMTELLLICTLTASVYELLRWHKYEKILHLVKAAFWIMMASLIRYEGWFLFVFAAVLIGIQAIRRKGYKYTEGNLVLYATFAGMGIVLWLLWNQLVFSDPLYFALGPFSARAQQKQIEAAGLLWTKGNLYFSVKTYLYALIYNSGAFQVLLAGFGAMLLWLDKKISIRVRQATVALLAPLLFNIIALYFGHSVLFIQGLTGDTWFNARYGIMLAPAVAIFIGYLINRFKNARAVLVGLLFFVMVFTFIGHDAVTIDDARVGSSQKNVSEVSGYLEREAAPRQGFVLISAASHDAIIFSSGMPINRFIHEGTGRYWEEATTYPEKWARWIIMRTHDENDLTFKAVSKTPYLDYYTLVEKYPFADVYQLKEEYLSGLNVTPNLGKQK